MTDTTATATERDRANRRLAHYAQQADDALKAAREHLGSEIVYAIANGARLDDNDVSDLVTAETVSALWTRARALDTVDLAAGVAHIARKTRDELIGNRYADRSTSVMANAFEDTRREATARWLRNHHVAWALDNA